MSYSIRVWAKKLQLHERSQTMQLEKSKVGDSLSLAALPNSKNSELAAKARRKSEYARTKSEGSKPHKLEQSSSDLGRKSKSPRSSTVLKPISNPNSPRKSMPR